MEKLDKITLDVIVDVLSEYDFEILEGDPMDRWAGYCDMDKKKIYISRTQTPNSFIKTLFHEFAHAYNAKHGLEDNEAIVGRIEKRSWRNYLKRRK